MSDLRERLMLVATDFNEWGHIRTPDQVVAALLPIIEAELQKRDRLRDQINDAYVRTEAALTEANKQLEELRDQGCEFCEAAIDDRITDEPEFMGNFKHSWICGRCWNDQGRKLTETNKLLEQTIEVLEEERKRVTVWFEHATHFEEELGNLRARTLAVLEACPIPETVAGTTRWWEAKAKPLLDNLKALTKEGTE